MDDEQELQWRHDCLVDTAMKRLEKWLAAYKNLDRPITFAQRPFDVRREHEAEWKGERW